VINTIFWQEFFRWNKIATVSTTFEIDLQNQTLMTALLHLLKPWLLLIDNDSCLPGQPCKSIFLITQCMQEKNVRETESVCAWYSAYVKCATAPTCNSTSVSFCSVYIHSHILLLVCGSVCMYIYVYLYMYVLSVWSCHLSKITMRMDKTFPWGQWLRLGTKF